MHAAPKAASVWLSKPLAKKASAALLPRLKTAEQFAAVLDASKAKAAQPAGVWRSAHFVLHMAPLSSLRVKSPAADMLASKADPDFPNAHDVANDASSAPQTLCGTTLGVICPKRWAKRAVTRNTIKRQIYAVSSELQAQLPAACLVLRLASAFSREQFTSATSPHFKRAVRQELLGLLDKVSLVKPPAFVQVPAALRGHSL